MKPPTLINLPRDEINIPPERLSTPALMGVSFHATSGFRPAAQFLVRASMTSEEVRRAYELSTQAEADESTEIKFVAKRDLLEEAESRREGEEEEEEKKDKRVGEEDVMVTEKEKDERVGEERNEEKGEVGGGESEVRTSDFIWDQLAPNTKGCLRLARKHLNKY